MTGRKNDPREELRRLADALAEDIMELSDEEILEEAAEDYEDVDTVVERTGELIEQAIIEVGKRRMKTAKAAVRKNQQDSQPDIVRLPVEKKREVLRQIAAQQHKSMEKMTRAARKEDELTESDLDATLEALFQLGVIDDQGNPR